MMRVFTLAEPVVLVLLFLGQPLDAQSAEYLTGLVREVDGSLKIRFAVWSLKTGLGTLNIIHVLHRQAKLKYFLNGCLI